MPLTQAYVNEVLNHLPSTVVVDETTWPELVRQLKFEGRDLTAIPMGAMTFRSTPGGYAGLCAQVDALLKENDVLRARVAALSTREEPVAVPEPVSIDG